MAEISAFFVVFTILAVLALAANVEAASAAVPRAKFYDFQDQLIDGEVKKPTTLYTDARNKVKFDRLLRLKKSFLKDLFKTAKERVFK
tara:strand:- start:6585 stop:6848 length:264 start_codon:yes stop_codon:yes gene_type:complete